MDQFEFAAVAAAIGWDQEMTAEALHIAPERVADWEAGRRRVPRKYAKRLRYLRDLSDRSAALERSGLPRCDWMDARNASELPDDEEELLVWARECNEHEEACEMCAARSRFISERFPPIKDPSGLPPISRLVGAVFDGIERLPLWSRPVVLCSLTVGFILLPMTLESPRVTLGAGAGAGATYELLRRFAWKPVAAGLAGAVGVLILVALDPSWSIRQLVTTTAGLFVLAVAIVLPAVESRSKEPR